MKIFLAGGSGAIGMRLIPQLIAQGHTVTAMTRSEGKRARLEELGAEVVKTDALDRAEVIGAVTHAAPEVVIHELTSLAGVSNLKHFDREFAATNRLRTQGTDNLLAGAKAAGASRFIAQSYAGWNYERRGAKVKREEDPFDSNPPSEQTESLRAIVHLERAVVEAEDLDGIALRYANFYGPGTSCALDGEITEMVRRRKFPIVGDGRGVWSFVHIDDAATATIAAIHRGSAGVYNIADDEPAPVAQWLPALAGLLGAKAPRRIPVWLGRLAAGDVGVSMMTQIRGVDNAKAKRELGWTPAHPSWRDGVAELARGATPARARAAS
jgi:nucleoside-diphosphate-sugar epimerase